MLSAVFCQVDMSVLDDWGRGKGRRAYVNALSRENDSLHVNSKASCHLTSVNLCVENPFMAVCAIKGTF